MRWQSKAYKVGEYVKVLENDGDKWNPAEVTAVSGENYPTSVKVKGQTVSTSTWEEIRKAS